MKLQAVILHSLQRGFLSLSLSFFLSLSLSLFLSLSLSIHLYLYLSLKFEYLTTAEYRRLWYNAEGEQTYGKVYVAPVIYGRDVHTLPPPPPEVVITL